MSLIEPTLIPRPWAENGAKDAIPDTTTVTGRASWSVGFPEENALPRKAGGIPPNWLDFQGVLNALSSHAVFEQAGGHYGWDSGLDYPVGACIIGSNNRLYMAVQVSGPGTSAGAKNPVTAANSAYWSVIAGPDGQTIILDANGRLKVSPNGIADGTTIVANGSGKLSVGAPATATLLADGTTITANNGKLTAVGDGAQPDGTTIIFNASSKLSVGAVATAALLADGITIVANNGKLIAVPSKRDPSELFTFQFVVHPDFESPSSSDTYDLEMPFDPSGVSADIISRYGDLSSVTFQRLTAGSYRTPTLSVFQTQILQTSAGHNTPYITIAQNTTDEADILITATAPVAWWQQTQWASGANSIPIIRTIETPFPPLDFGNTATANLQGFFSACTGLEIVRGGMFSMINNGRYTNITLQQCFDGCTALTNIPEGIFDGLETFSGTINLNSVFADYTVARAMGIRIKAGNVNAASSMFAGHSGSGAMTFTVPAGSTTYTTLSTAYSGTNWITVTGV